jgi:hypothetical protein
MRAVHCEAGRVAFRERSKYRQWPVITAAMRDFSLGICVWAEPAAITRRHHGDGHACQAVIVATLRGVAHGEAFVGRQPAEGAFNDPMVPARALPGVSDEPSGTGGDPEVTSRCRSTPRTRCLRARRGQMYVAARCGRAPRGDAESSRSTSTQLGSRDAGEDTGDDMPRSLRGTAATGQSPRT